MTCTGRKGNGVSNKRRPLVERYGVWCRDIFLTTQSHVGTGDKLRREVSPRSDFTGRDKTDPVSRDQWRRRGHGNLKSNKTPNGLYDLVVVKTDRVQGNRTCVTCEEGNDTTRARRSTVRHSVHWRVVGPEKVSLSQKGRVRR